MKHDFVDIRVPFELDNPSIYRDESLCVNCGRCKDICKYKIGVNGNFDLKKTNDKAICIYCGQCALNCPTGALKIVDDTKKFFEAANDPDKVLVAFTAPSTRVQLGEAFGVDFGTNIENKMVSYIRALGAKYVFDVCFGADLTIMEEASEFVERLKTNKNLPQLTSCCPAWVKFVEYFEPDFIKNLSTTKSPISMIGAMVKTYFAKKMNIPATKIVSCAIVPCTAKKYERGRKELSNCYIFNKDKEPYSDIDIVLTTQELINMGKQKNIDFKSLKDDKFDSLLSHSSGAGVIFGTSGGVMEAALRTAYFLVEGKDPSDDFLNLKAVRGDSEFKEANVSIGGRNVKVAVIYGTKMAQTVLNAIRLGEMDYDFIEVMTCPHGCVGGGGSPKSEFRGVEKMRASGLYNTDEKRAKRASYANDEIIKLYNDFLITPLSDNSKLLLHTHYNNDKHLLGETDE